MALYLDHVVTTAESTRKEQKRDLILFHDFMVSVYDSDKVTSWTPRLSKMFKDYMVQSFNPDGHRRWSDVYVNRVVSHLKTFASWIESKQPFPLGNPMSGVKLIPVSSSLLIDRALTTQERNKMLDASDLLILTGGLSKDHYRFRGKDPLSRSKRKLFRPYRDRAVVYTLIETGMRRTAVSKIRIVDVDFNTSEILVLEKGGHSHLYMISSIGLAAIKDYIDKERSLDTDGSNPYLFVPVSHNNSSGRLSPCSINNIWNSIAARAGVEGKTCHSARHSMGRHIIDTKGNVAAVQRQLGHKNAAYSMQYMRVTKSEMKDILDRR